MAACGAPAETEQRSLRKLLSVGQHQARPRSGGCVEAEFEVCVEADWRLCMLVGGCVEAEFGGCVVDI